MSTDTATKRLWDVDHPYYAEEGNYYSNECHEDFDSWQEFAESGWIDSDPDMNLVYRWDWWTPDHDDREWAAEDGREVFETLKLYWVLQRKAIHRSIFIRVTRDQEPEIRMWLAGRAQTIAAIWEPIRPGYPE